MKLGLTRGDFNIFAEQTLKSLLQETDFSDVSLVCEDGTLIRAHKVVLSSGSEFFRSLLLKNEHPSPLIYLRLAADHLQALVGFIYTGECHVEQSHIENFLEVARELQVSGLAVERQKDFEKRHQSQSLIGHQEEEEGGLLSSCEDDLQKAHEDTDSKTQDFPSPENKCEFKCDWCGEMKSSEPSLKVHIKMKHKVAESKANPPEKKVSSTYIKGTTAELLKFMAYVTTETEQNLEEVRIVEICLRLTSDAFVQVLAEENGKEVVGELFLDYLANFRF